MNNPSIPIQHGEVETEASPKSPNSPIGKVVVIGLSKTGTTTLKDMLATLGYRVCGPEKDLLADVRAGNFKNLDAVLDAYDAFEDWPWPLTYRYVLDRYGRDTKFILSTRISTEKWFRSIEQHGYGTGLFKSMRHTYGYYRPFGREKEFSHIYESHNEEARRFFADYPDQFIEFCLEKGDGWEKLCQFIGRSQPEKPVPHRNRTERSKRKINRLINVLVAPFYKLVSR